MFEDFRESFKYYKSKNPGPELDAVIDFNNPDDFADRLKEHEISQTNGGVYGLKSVSTWEVYELTDHPGQRYWTVRCLRDYSRKPNKTNLDVLNLLPQNKDWWNTCQNGNKLLLNKLRWVTLGYHHDWDTKVYSEENRGEFPKDLYDLSLSVAQKLGFSNFSAEAAIVNYYHMDSTLSGHTDHSENDLEAPLFSFSFGQTAIFLIGGKDREDPTSAMFLRSGDIVVMSAEARLCYHGVPKILQMDSRFWGTYTPADFCSTKECKDVLAICKSESSWKPYGDYLSHSRINLNVRQVLRRGQKRLSDDKM